MHSNPRITNNNRKDIKQQRAKSVWWEGAAWSPVRTSLGLRTVRSKWSSDRRDPEDIRLQEVRQVCGLAIQDPTDHQQNLPICSKIGSSTEDRCSGFFVRFKNRPTGSERFWFTPTYRDPVEMQEKHESTFQSQKLDKNWFYFGWKPAFWKLKLLEAVQTFTSGGQWNEGFRSECHLQTGI